MDQGDEYGDADEDPEDDTMHLISYCHRHCRVDKERQKRFGCYVKACATARMETTVSSSVDLDQN